MVKHDTFANALYYTLHVMITEEQMSSFVGNEFDVFLLNMAYTADSHCAELQVQISMQLWHLPCFPAI